MTYQFSIYVLSFSALILVFNLILLFKRGINRPVTLFFNGLFLFLFVLVPLLNEYISGALTVRWGEEYKINQPNFMLIYSVYVVLISLTFMLLITNTNISNNNENIVSDKINRAKAEFSEFGYLLISLVGLGIIFYTYGTRQSFFDLIQMHRFEWMSLGEGNGFFLLLSWYFLSLFAPATLAIMLQRKKSYLKIMLILSMLIMIFLAEGGRKYLIYVLSGYGASRIWAENRLSIKMHDIILAVGAISFLIGLQFVRFFREWSFDKIAAALLSAGKKMITEGDLSYFYRASLESIALSQNEGILYPLAVIRRIVFMFVPGEWTFGLKPPGIPHMFALDINNVIDIRVGNMPPSIVGIFVLSFGIYIGAVLFGFLLPILIWKIDTWLRQGSPIAIVSSSYVLMIMVSVMRGNVGDLNYLVFFVILYLMLYYSKKIIKLAFLNKIITK